MEYATSAHAQEAYPLTRTSQIALQVVRTSFEFHLRECMGSCFPPPPLLRTLAVFDTSQGERKQISPISPLFCRREGVLARLVRRNHH